MAAPDAKDKIAEEVDDPRSRVEWLQRVALDTLVREAHAEDGLMGSNDPEEQWFEPEDLARRTLVELKEDAGILRTDDRAEDAARTGLSLRQLRGWRNAGAMGAGLGDEVEETLGTILPGDVLVVDAERPAMADALVNQLVEALALDPHTGPSVIVMHGAGVDDVLTRRRARWGGSAMGTVRATPHEATSLASEITEAWHARLRHVPPGVMYGDDLLEQIIRDTERWTRGRPPADIPVILGITGLAVWERYQDAGGIPEADESPWLMQLLRTARSRGWVVIGSSRCARARATVARAVEEGIVRARVSLEVDAAGGAEDGSPARASDSGSFGGEGASLLLEEFLDGAPRRRVTGFSWDWRRGRFSRCGSPVGEDG